jgi:hypothetical protein
MKKMGPAIITNKANENEKRGHSSAKHGQF